MPSFVHNNNCLIDLYNRDLQTTIILFTRIMSSHKTDWILSMSSLLTLSCFSYCRVNSLMNALEFRLREIFINGNKLFLLFLYFAYVFPYSAVIDCLFPYPFFYTDVVAVFVYSLIMSTSPVIMFLKSCFMKTVAIFAIVF